MAQGKSENDRFLAEIPWIERPIGDKRMEDTNFYKAIGEQSPLEEKIKRLQLFWILNETFPFYLPQRYHAMDCLALHKNSKDGNYWANATVYLFNITALGHSFLSNVDDFLKFGKPDLKSLAKSTSHYKTIKQKYLKNNLEEGGSAAEFLLDPWVLLQLPLEPMLMYQWAVALMAEVAKIEKEMNPIVHLAGHKQLFAAISKLNEMRQKLYLFAQHLLATLFFYTQCQRGNYHHFLHVKHGKDLVKSYAETMPIIEFVLRGKYLNVVNSLKKWALKSWKNTWGGNSMMYRQTVCCGFPFSKFNLFWNQEDKLFNLMIPPKDVISLDEIYDRTLNHPYTPEQLEKFFDETLVKTGISKESEREYYQTFQPKLPGLLEFLSLTALLDGGHAGVHKTGIISSVVRLQILAAKTEILTMLLCTLDNDAKHYKRAVEKEIDWRLGPDLNLRQILDVISKVQPDQKWSYRNIIKGVKNNFDEKLMEFPDLDQSAHTRALHLQERIKRLVLKMIERQFGSFEDDRFLHYPECQFVQLILPCFVASFLDLCKDPLATEEAKRVYFEIINEMVKSYETTEFSNKIESRQEAIHFACFVNTGFKNPYLQTRCEFVEHVLSQLNQKIHGDFLNKGVSSKFFVDSTLGQDEEISLGLQHWSHLVFMFNSRQRSVLRKIGIPDHPNLISYETQIFTLPIDLEKVTVEQMWLLKARIWLKDFGKVPAELEDEEKENLLNSGVPIEIIQNLLAVSEPQLDGIALYLTVNYFAEDKIIARNKYNLQKPGFPLDPVVSAFWYFDVKDMWKLKLQLANLFIMREGNEDPTLIPFDIAEANSCYKHILKLVTPEGNVPMSRPGEITLFPVKHCRWCGQVKVKEFRVCPVCAEMPDYPDLNFFCSEECEKEALENQHEEEHINFEMEQCGIVK